MSDSGRTVVLDSEALSLVAGKDADILAFLSFARRYRNRVVVPTAVLAEVITGRASDAQVWHAVNRLVTQDITRDIAGEAGALRERAEEVRAKKKDLTVDAMVAAVARQFAPSVVLTCDVEDLKLLCEGANVVVRHPREARL